MENNKMLHIIGDYYLGADRYCLILYKRGEVSGEGSKKAKPENIGKETYNAIGYYTGLKSVMKGLSKRYLYDAINSDDVNDFKDLIQRMADLIDGVERIEESYQKLLEDRMGGRKK